jgi:hypothetical protein
LGLSFFFKSDLSFLKFSKVVSEVPVD